MEPNFLLIDTSASESSVAVWNGALKKYAFRSGDQKGFTEIIPSLLSDLLKEAELSLNDVSAVAVNAGPGSYTGLRAGVSFAKGLCFGLNKPLIAISALQVLSHIAKKENPEGVLFLPMIDAGRMEVYAALYSDQITELQKAEPKIADEFFYRDYQQQSLIFFGSGAKKCLEVFAPFPWKFAGELKHTALDFIELAQMYFRNKTFSPVMDFDPVYLKEFVALKKRNT